MKETERVCVREDERKRERERSTRFRITERVKTEQTEREEESREKERQSGQRSRDASPESGMDGIAHKGRRIFANPAELRCHENFRSGKRERSRKKNLNGQDGATRTHETFRGWSPLWWQPARRPRETVLTRISRSRRRPDKAAAAAAAARRLHDSDRLRPTRFSPAVPLSPPPPHPFRRY